MKIAKRKRDAVYASAVNLLRLARPKITVNDELNRQSQRGQELFLATLREHARAAHDVDLDNVPNDQLMRLCREVGGTIL